ncbi:unnamed protein product, partial [marine sediment metagenome]
EIEFEEKRKELSKIRREAIKQLGNSLHPNIRDVFIKS